MNKKATVKVDDIQKEAQDISCPVEKSYYLIDKFLEGPMCGRCFPCSMGSYEMRILLKKLMKGKCSKEEAHHIREIADQMVIASLCKKGKDIGRYILEWHDSEVLDLHRTGTCPAKTCKDLVQYLIIPDKCTMCGDCLKACKYHAIHGEKMKPFSSGYHPFEIRQQKCVRCGDCLPVCAPQAIIIVNVKDRETVSV